MAKTVFDVLIQQIEEQKLSSTQFLTSLIEDLSRNQMEEDDD
jgi:hypothetical protein